MDNIPNSSELEQAVSAPITPLTPVDREKAAKERFAKACEVYKDFLLKNVAKSTQNIRNYRHRKVHLFDLEESIKTGARINGIRMDILHYGGFNAPRNVKTTWVNRKWQYTDVPVPFVEVQRALLKEKGLYLYETSDPSKSLGVFIVISLDPPREQPKLWHGYEKVPEGQ